ncbi:MAG: hypothetical protein ACYDBQ_10515, partial [Thermoplasmatota archaeon]
DGGSLHVAVTGSPSAAALAGHVIPVDASAWGTAGWVVAGAGTAAVGVGALGWWWRATRRDLLAIKVAMKAGKYEEVVRRSTPRLLRLRRQGDGVRTQLAVSLLLLGRADEAAAALADWRRGPQATSEYLWACVHALRGETAQAAARVQACLQKDPALGRQLLGDPLFAMLSRPPAAPRRQDGYA